MAGFLDDTIDFAAYSQMTESAQRVFSTADYADEVIDYFHSEEEERGAMLPWRKFNGKVLFRPGEVSLWCGMNGHGKSLVLGQMATAFIPQGQRTCIASLEMKPRLSLARQARQAAKTNKPSPTYLREFCGALTDGFQWMYDHQGVAQTDTVAGVANYCAQKLGCTQFILDSLTKCGVGEDDYDRQKRFVDQLCAIARDTGLHIHLVVHSRKLQDETKPPTKMDIKGSGSISDQADNVFIWWRNKPKEEAERRGAIPDSTEPDGILSCEKQRNGEWEGKVGLFFDPASLQYKDSKNSPPMDLFKHPRENIGNVVYSFG